MGNALGLRVTIIALDGKVLGDTDLTREQVLNAENHAGRIEVKEALNGGIGISKRFSNTLKEYMLYTAIPFRKEKTEGVLRFSVPMHEVEILKAKAALRKIILRLSICFPHRWSCAAHGIAEIP